MEKKHYRVICHKFVGGNDEIGYTYEITLNKSMVHTGKHRGIEDGLNRYDRWEPFNDLLESIRIFFKRIFKTKL